MQNIIGVLNCGDGDDEGGRHEEGLQPQVHAGGVHVVGPHGEAHGGYGYRADDYRLVAEDGPSGHDGDDHGDGPHHGQDHDVHRGMRVEPEQMLPEQRVASPCFGEREEGSTQVPVEQEQDEGGSEDRGGQDHHGRGGEDRPQEQVHVPKLDARRPQHDYGGQEVHGSRYGTDAHQHHPHEPEVHADPGLQHGQGDVGRPSHRGGTDPDQDPGREEGPVGEGVQAGERHIWRAA